MIVRPILSAVIGLSLTTYTLPAQANQSAIVRDISSPDRNIRGRAVARAASITPDSVDSELRQALFTALRLAGDSTRIRDAQTRAGVPSGRRGDDDGILVLVEAVVRLHDAASIPALASAMFVGTPIVNELARYGEPGVQAVLGAMRNPRAMRESLTDGLISLRLAVEMQASRPLRPQTINQIRAVAAQYLGQASGADPAGVRLGRATDLAIALGDTDLRGIVASLASSPEAIRVRGITDSRAVARVRQRAAERLAGVPALPRP